MRKSKFKQTMSMLLAVLMVFMSMNFSVFAEELTAPTDETTTTTVEAPVEQPAEEQTPAVEALAPVNEETGTTEENAVIQETPAMMALSDSEYLAPRTPALDEMTGKECFFANGTPITIEATTTEGKGAKITWNGGSQEVSSAANIFGGGHNHDGTYESTSVTMTGGTVNAVFGGGLHKSHVATTNVVIKDGAVIGQIAGGAASSFSGTTCHKPWPEIGNPNAFVDITNVTIEGGTIKGSALVYGGSEGMSQTGDANLTITGGTFDKAYIIPGGSNGTTTGTATVTVSTDVKNSIVQGVNRGSIGNVVINTQPGAKVDKVYAGGETGDAGVTGTIGKATVNITAGSTVANLQPGTNGGTEIAANSTELITLNYDDSAVINADENTLEKLEARFGAAVLGKTAKPIAVTDAEGKVISGYDDIQTAVTEAPTNSVIKLQKDIDIAQTIQYGGKNLTFDGNNKTYKLKSTAKDRIFMLTGTGDTGTGLTLRDLEVIGNNTSQRGIHVGDITDATNNNHYKAQIILDNAELKFDFCADPRGINLGDGQHQGSSITLTNNSKILNGLNQEYENDWGNSGNGSRGLSLWNPKDVTVNIEKNSALKGFKYAVNVSGTQQTVDDKLLADAEGLNVTVDNSTIYGWAAFNIWASYGTYNIQNGSVLKGINTVEGAAGSANAFTTIKLNYDWPADNGNGNPVYQTYDNVLNITDSTITNGKSGSFDQYLLSIDNAETVESISLTGAHFVDVTGTIESAINIYDDGNKSGSVSKAIDAVKAKTTIDETSTSVYQPAESDPEPLPFYDIIAANGEKEYQNLQDAVDDAVENDTIIVKEGIHNLYQTLRISKPVTIKGEDNKTVVITRKDDKTAWTPKDGKAIDAETGSLILIEKTQNVNIENITVQGAKKITGSPNANGHGINIVQSTNVALNNVTSKDSAAAGVVVNGSTVTATGLYTSGNGWYGVNVDQGSGVTDDTSFTLDTTKPYRLSDRLQIVSDKYADSDNINVYADGFAQRSYNAEDGHEVVYWVDEAMLIRNTTKQKTYTTIQEAINDATRGNSIEIPAGTYNDTLDINKSGLILKKVAGDGECVLDGVITVNNKNINIQDISAGSNAKITVKKDTKLILKNATGFDTDKKTTVEKLFGTEYDTSTVTLSGEGIAKDRLGFTYLGEEIKPDTNLFRANEVSYTVKTPAQFYWLSQQINAGNIDTSKVTIKLGNDLDFRNDEWLPVGTAEHPYQGSFDGQNHKIENLKITRLVNTTNRVGLFGQVNNGKEFKDITIHTASISGNEHISAFIGNGHVISLIDNIHIKNAELVGTHFAGGVVGQGYVTNLQNCTAENVTVTLSDANKKLDGDKAGAIIGQLCEGNMTIRNCTATNAVVSGVRDVGGVVGMAQYGNILQNCTVNGGSVTSTGIELFNPYAGGVVGRLGGEGNQKVTIYQCSSNETAVSGQDGYTGPVYGGPAENFVAAAALNTNTGKVYTSIQTAINEATAGDTIEIQAGTYDESITLTKALNLIGPYAATEIKAENATIENRPDETEAVLTGGITINRTDTAQNPSITISGLKFKTNGILATGWGSDPKLENVTIKNNVFDALRPSGNVAAIHFNLAEGMPATNLTIDNNRITDVGDSTAPNPNPSGINTDVVEGTTKITNNYIDGTNHSSLQISNKATGEVTITGNTFKNWDQNYVVDYNDKDNGGGRAIRLGDFSGASLTVSQNKMVRTFEGQGLDKDEMVKFTKVPESGEFDLSLNYWNGKLPVTTYGKANDNSVIVASEGKAKINALPYYIDEAMTQTRVPAEVFGSDGQSKGQYLTIQEAIGADSTKEGDIIQLADGVYTDTFSLSKNVTVKGAENGKSILQCTADPSGNGENAAILNMGTDKTAKVQNVEFSITKTGQSPINFSTAGSLTVEGCNFTGIEEVYGNNVIYGGGQKDATVIFKNNTVNLPYRMAITSLGNNSEVTGNTFNIGTDRIGDEQRTSILTVVAAEGIVNISDNIFMGVNRAIGVDHSSLAADKLTIKNNQFIDVRYGFELGSTANKDCGVYDLSENYYATTVSGTEVASPMLIEDADKSGSHFNGETDYTGDQANVYPYYTKRAFNEETQKYVLSGLYAPVEVQHIDGDKSTEYFGTIAKAYEAAHAGDTIVINKAADGSGAIINENINMGTKDADLKLMGSTIFKGTFAGSTRVSLILQNGTTATFTNAEQNAIQYFTSVDVENFNAEALTQVIAPTANTSQNSFIAKGGLMDYVKGDSTSRWTYGSPSDRFNGGDGTAEKPWQINTPEQLKLLQTPEFETKDKYFKLTNDITVNDWTPLAKFEGNFDGNGYSITGSSVNFIDELVENAKVEKLRFEGFTNLVNTNNGTVENCYTVGEKTTAIVNIMGSGGTLTDSFTAGTKAVQTNNSNGTVLRVYHCGETGGIGTAMTKADMQKARFANTLNSDKVGVWNYDTITASETAYPFVLKDGKTTTIQPINVTVTPEKVAGAKGYAERVAPAPDEKIYANDDVKVKATLTDTEHSVFDSWTVNDVKVDTRTAEATIKVKDAETVIHANFIDKPKVMVNVSPQGAGSIYMSLNDGPEQKLTTSTYIQQIYVGSKVTVRAEGYDIPGIFTTVFRYWIDASTGQKLSSEPTYTIASIGSPRVIQAVFEEKEQDSYKVQFNDINGNELNSGYYKTTDTINVPAAPILSGYEFVEWTGSDGSKIDKDTKNITGIKADTSYKATYKAAVVKYTISVTDGTINGQANVEVEQRTNVTAVANAAPTGKVFIGWQEVVDGTPTGVYLSYSESYTFAVTRNMTLKAIYEDSKPVDTVHVILDPTPIVSKTSVSPELYKVQFLIKVEVPIGYKVVETGVIYKNAEVQNIDELEINKDNVMRRAAPIVPTSQFSMSVSNIASPFEITGRAYAILDNGTIVYSGNTAFTEVR